MRRALLNKSERQRERRCIVHGRPTPPAALIRFVRTPDGAAALDLAEKLPGRGAWVSADWASIDKAARTGAFSRAFKAATRAPDDLAAEVADRLRRRALEALGLARRAGAAVSGFDQTCALLAEGGAGLVVTAGDAADDGAAKIGRRAGATPVIRAFSSAELSQALGRAGVRHMALKTIGPGLAARRAVERFTRFGSAGGSAT